MSNTLERNPNRVSFDPKDADIPAFDEIAEEKGLSRAELLRRVVKREVGQAEDGDNLPSEPTLREGYKAMDRRTGPDSSRMRADEAKTAVAEATKVPKSAVKRAVFEPLRRRGFLTPRSGFIYLETPTPSVNRTSAPADD